MTADPDQFGRRRLRPADQTAKPPDLAELIAPGVEHELPPTSVDTWRYLRVAWFFARMFLSVLWWDLFLRHVPGCGAPRSAARCSAGRPGRNGFAGWRCHKGAS